MSVVRAARQHHWSEIGEHGRWFAPDREAAERVIARAAGEAQRQGLGIRGGWLRIDPRQAAVLVAWAAAAERVEVLTEEAEAARIARAVERELERGL